MGFTYTSTVGTQSYIGWFLRAIPSLQNGFSLESCLKNERLDIYLFTVYMHVYDM